MNKKWILPLLAIVLTACPVEKVNVNAITGINATATPNTVASAGSSSLNAAVSGTGTFNQAVNWNVVSGGGSLSSGTGSTITYTAPTVTVQTPVQIKAVAAGNTNFSQTLALSVTPIVNGSKPVISSFTATPPSLPTGGGNTTLAWTVTGATSLSIDGGVGDVTGATSKSVAVTATKTFTLTATNTSGSSTSTVDVTVGTATLQPGVWDSSNWNEATWQ